MVRTIFSTIIAIAHAFLCRNSPHKSLRRDNRTSHCNCPGEIARLDGGGKELLRATVYVCMSPRASASPEAIAQRQASYHVCHHESFFPNQLF